MSTVTWADLQDNHYYCIGDQTMFHIGLCEVVTLNGHDYKILKGVNMEFDEAKVRAMTKLGFAITACPNPWSKK